MKPETSELVHLADHATTLLKALSHPARLMICCQLRQKEMSVGDIETTLDIKQPRLSRELGKLREEGLVQTRRESKVIFYSLSDAPYVKEMIDAICAVMLEEPVSTTPNTQAHQPARRSLKKGGYSVFAQPTKNL